MVQTNPYILAKLFEADDRGGRIRSPPVRSKLRAETRQPSFLSVRDLSCDYDQCCEHGDVVDIIVMDHEPLGLVQEGDPESPHTQLSVRFGNSDVEIGRGSVQVTLTLTPTPTTVTPTRQAHGCD